MSMILKRPRRNRRLETLRSLIRETSFSSRDFILPLFIKDGKNIRERISGLPESFVLSIDEAVKEAKVAFDLGISGLILFPQIKSKLKNPKGSESWNKKGLLQRAIQEIKNALPQMTLFSDVAMDPYSSDGHDGYVKNAEVCNDETLEILALMALSQAEAGVDFIAPSDMMDGRVGFLRKALDCSGFKNVGILSYSAKYASSLYDPFRDILNSNPKFCSTKTVTKKENNKKNLKGEFQSINHLMNKKTYQMDPANVKEAFREGILDEEEGADILMIKPALFYLDVICNLKNKVHLPIAAYLVSGEEAMIYAAGEKGLLSSEETLMEAITAIKRAGADMIVTYSAIKVAKEL